MNDDLISRQLMQDILDRVSAMHPYKQIGNRESYGTYNEAWTDAINMVDAELNSLPSAQPENTDCDYCHEDSDGYVKPVEKNCHAFIRSGMDGWELSLKANGWHGSAKIKYCPMCGRRLKNDK